MRVLIVTAVAAESDSAARGLRTAAAPRGPAAPGSPDQTLSLPAGTLRRLTIRGAVSAAEPGQQAAELVADLMVGGVGPAAAAAAAAGALTAAELAGEPYDLVVAAGIAGGFPGVAPVGSVVVAESVAAADLGAETPEGFVPVTVLGFGTGEHRPPATLSPAVADALTAVYGTVLTVSTVTGSSERAADLTRRHPGAAAEAMEGFGVAEAAAAHGVPVLEIRAVSNPVGPRDRAAWRIGDALDALATAFAELPGALAATRPQD
jgi:futalosine hydrolase